MKHIFKNFISLFLIIASLSGCSKPTKQSIPSVAGHYYIFTNFDFELSQNLTERDTNELYEIKMEKNYTFSYNALTTPETETIYFGENGIGYLNLKRMEYEQHNNKISYVADNYNTDIRLNATFYSITCARNNEILVTGNSVKIFYSCDSDNIYNVYKEYKLMA